MYLNVVSCTSEVSQFGVGGTETDFSARPKIIDLI